MGSLHPYPTEKEVLILPIDKNVPVKKKDYAGNEEKLCDFLMRSYRSYGFLFFIELKDKRKVPWVMQANNEALPSIGIKSTIKLS